MFHELTHFPLFNSLTILKELAVSLLHRTTSLRPEFFTSLSIPLLVLIQLARKLVNILIPNFFLLPSFLVRMTKRGRRLRCIFFTIFVIHVHVLQKMVKKIHLSLLPFLSLEPEKKEEKRSLGIRMFTSFLAS